MTALLEGPTPDHMKQPDATVHPDRPARWEIRGRRLLVTGAVDQSSRSTVRDGFIEILHDRDVSVIDLSGVTFFGAAGVSLLHEFALHERYDVIGTAQIQRILDIVGSGHLLTVVRVGDSTT